MSEGGAPESWDQDVPNQFSKLNVNASEFVPSWGIPAAVTPESSKPNLFSLFLCQLKLKEKLIQFHSFPPCLQRFYECPLRVLFSFG